MSFDDDNGGSWDEMTIGENHCWQGLSAVYHEVSKDQRVVHRTTRPPHARCKQGEALRVFGKFKGDLSFDNDHISDGLARCPFVSVRGDKVGD